MIKVLEERTSDDSSEVKADLGVEDVKRFKQGVVFRLKRKEDRWFISDIVLVFDEKLPRATPGHKGKGSISL